MYRRGTSAGRLCTSCGPWGGSEPLLQALQRDPETFAVVDMTLPDLGDEAGVGRDPGQVGGQPGEVDVALPDLEALAVDSGGVDDVQVSDGVAEDAGEVRQRPAAMVGRQLRVGHVEAEAAAGPPGQL